LWKRLRLSRTATEVAQRGPTRFAALADRAFPASSVERFYRASTGRGINLSGPKTFSEKLQWLKLNHRNPYLTTLVDKYAARDHVRGRTGEEFLVPLLAVWDDPSDIVPEALPGQFVLKATHGSGWNVFCHDARQFDWDETRKQLASWLKLNFYYVGFEWPYRHVRPRVMAEIMLHDPNRTSLLDYKFFCFDGIPRIVQVDVDRFSCHRRSMLDTAWRELPFQLAYPRPIRSPDRPTNLDEMLAVAGALSEGLPFVRVDLYCVQRRTFFGEMTFFPGAGIEPFEPYEWDRRLGDMLRLPR
jgi:hypothetical protein